MKRLPQKPESRGEYNIKIDVRTIGFGLWDELALFWTDDGLL